MRKRNNYWSCWFADRCPGLSRAPAKAKTICPRVARQTVAGWRALRNEGKQQQKGGPACNFMGMVGSARILGCVRVPPPLPPPRSPHLPPGPPPPHPPHAYPHPLFIPPRRHMSHPRPPLP
eukprot:9474268-Pyramimonas_sp.AAC.1